MVTGGTGEGDMPSSEERKTSEVLGVKTVELDFIGSDQNS